MAPGRPALARRLLAEVGRDRAPGHGGRRLGHRRDEPTRDDVGLQLFYNSTATVLGLTVLILLFGPASGAHFNPLVSAADWWLGRRAGTGLSGREVGAYTAAQTAGGVAGAVLANVMFDVPTTISTHDRSDWHLWVGEVVATAGLVALIFALTRTGRGAWAAPAVGAYIGAAYWFTSSSRSRTRPSRWGACSRTPSPGSSHRRCPGSWSRRSSAPLSASVWCGGVPGRYRNRRRRRRTARCC